MSTAADLGYVGVEDFDLVPFKRFPGDNLTAASGPVQDMANSQRKVPRGQVANSVLAGRARGPEIARVGL